MESKTTLLKDIRSLQGQGTRSYQQDSFAYADKFFLVADGVGGSQDGDKASKSVIDTMERLGLSQSEEVTQDTLLDWVEVAWHAVDQLSPDSFYTPSTTLAGVWMTSDNSYLAAHIGDSRVYHFRPGAITQIMYRSCDDTETDSLLMAQFITPIEALLHPRRSVISRAISGRCRHPVTIDKGATLQAGDYLLLCSDGLIENLTDEMLRFIFAPYRSLDEIVELLNRHMSLTEDNHTAIIVRFDAVATPLCEDELSTWQDFDPDERSLIGKAPLET